MKEEKSEYGKDLSLDKDALDKELVEFSEMFMKWAERYAESIAERDERKSEIEIEKAKLDKEVRSKPEDFNLAKITENAILNIIVENEKMILLNKELIECNKRVNILGSVKEAASHKRKMIEKLVELFLAGYWSDPKIKKENKNELDVKMRRRRKL